MTAPTVQVRQLWQPLFTGGWRGVIVALILLGALAACSSHPVDTRAINALPALQLGDHSVAVATVASRVHSPDLLVVDAPMREFVQHYSAGAVNRRQLLTSLHAAIMGAGALDLQYDPLADAPARETFHRGAANCLSYASLFVALAREAGLDAGYQWLEVRPQWSRVGERVSVGLHVNVFVDLGRQGQYMVDIDPPRPGHVVNSRKISDSQARALYHANIGMDALASDDLEQAWLQTVRALQLSPQMAHFWINLGAIYRAAGQHREAEDSYLYALQLDSSAYSAMANLVILYGIEGRQQELEYWEDRVEGYRQSNPFYHAWLGDLAGEKGDWRQALRHYDEVLELLGDDSAMLFARGLIHYRLDQLDAAAADMKRAIDGATLRSEIDSYQQALDALRREQVAAL
jgi:Flp pilus assembly protein TadD